MISATSVQIFVNTGLDMIVAYAKGSAQVCQVFR